MASRRVCLFLIDRILKPGGFIEFDDYDWSHATSAGLNPRIFPKVNELYTEEQIRTKQVGLVVDLLVKRDPRYISIVPNRIFQKSS